MNQWLTLGLLMVLFSSCLAQANRRKPPKVKVPEVDATCMNCLCQASSNCDETIKCHNSGGNSYFCGPYVISWAYWHDAGRPGDKGHKHDFETCLNNKPCAEEAVRGYMRKYGQDCDRSGSIDCIDFARIHKLGYGSCGSSAIEDSDYWQKFEACYTGYPSYPGNDGVADNADNAGYADNAGHADNADYPDYGAGVIQARNGRLN